MSEMDQGNTVAPTNLPWVAIGQQIRDTSEFGVSIAYCGTVGGAGVAKDGTIKSFGVSESEAKNHAAFITRACNSHYALVEALEDAVLQVEYLHEKFRITGSGEAATSRARAALAAAKGET